MKLLITGTFGSIGSAVWCHLQKRPDTFELYGTDRRTDVRDSVPAQWRAEVTPERFKRGDLVDVAFAKEAIEGMDAVVHLAAEANPMSTWENILRCNLMSTYNVFETARQAGVTRIVYASSIRVSQGYCNHPPYRAIAAGRFDEVPADLPKIRSEQPVWPVEPYGASKVWGEALGRAYTEQYDMSCICLRIGAVTKENRPRGRLGPIWCSLEDITCLIELSLDAPPDLGFDIFYGVSANRFCWVDIDHARERIGYEPCRSAEDFDMDHPKPATDVQP